ncbi:hypothetical protein EU546_01120 [Candidatus Thorarchaeota archaeon]|nr:MAG: hypothetical protein EU546_01120 [Candidatus Thorarchaeota archaeon]
MSPRTTASTSLNLLRKRCDEVDFQLGKQVHVRSSPRPSALLASAILCRSLKRSDRLFLFSVCPLLESVDTVNNLRDTYKNYSLIFLGVDLEGKKRIKKGPGYPLFIGGEFDSDKAARHSIGDNRTMLAATYALADTKLDIVGYETALAAMGTLLGEDPDSTGIKANKELLDQAIDEKALEEKQGLRLVGANRLGLTNLLLQSTRPFLQGVSGDQKACSDILDDADIPTTKYNQPLRALTTKEIQRLNNVLISKVPAIIPYLEPEYMAPHEKDTSPLQSTSDICALLETSWGLREFGTAFSVLLGDRGASLRGLLDSHTKHREETVSAIIGLQDSLEEETLPDRVTLRVSDRVLTDVGRIVFDLGLVDEKTPQIALSNDSNTEIVWRDDGIQIGEVLRRLKSTSTEIVTTSLRSIRLPKLPDEDLVDVMKTVIGED